MPDVVREIELDIVRSTVALLLREFIVPWEPFISRYSNRMQKVARDAFVVPESNVIAAWNV